MNGYGEEMNKSSSEIYCSIVNAKLRPSIQGGIFYFLHFSNINYLLTEVKTKEINSGSCWSYINKAKACDILFNYTFAVSHSLGIEQKLACKYSDYGLSTGIIDTVHNGAVLEGFDQVYPGWPLYPVSSIIEREIREQVENVWPVLKKYCLNNEQKELGYSYICACAMLIEALANSLKKMLYRIKPKRVILMGIKHYSEVAMQIACREMDIRSITVPHGILSKSMAPVMTSSLMSFSPYHDDYLKGLCSKQSRVEPLGWLEPQVKLGKKMDEILDIKASTKNDGKHAVLFLSQYSGAKINRCWSYYCLLPEIMKILISMPEVEQVIFRLHPGEEVYKNMIERLFKDYQHSKLTISVNEPLSKNLLESNILMSISSSALLYGPYLNMKAVEIRDKSIDSVCNSVLPEKNVFRIDDSLKPADLRNFINNSIRLDGRDIFYNWLREEERLGDSKIIKGVTTFPVKHKM